MLLPELNLPVNFAGKDGFYWWIGQIETSNDVKNTNRYKVRIVGQHVKSCSAVPVDDLPWAVVMLPVTAPSSEGNSNYSPAKLQKGDWVIGFFLDGAEGQHPVIMGNLQKVTNSSKNNSLSNNPSSAECLAFNRYVPSTNPYVALPNNARDKADKKPTGTNEAPAVVIGSGQPTSPTNPSGRYACVQLADVACKDTSQTRSRFEQVLVEFFGSVSKSGGQVGTQMLSDVTGTLVDYAGAGKGYVNRVFGIAMAYVRAAKYQMLSLIKKGISEVIKFCLGIPAPDSSPVAGQAKKQNKVGMLGTITTWLNEQLGFINCSIADLEKKLLKFLENLFTDLITRIINSATCVIESIISEILNEIQGFLVGLIDAVLGPLQSILSIVASPLNILSAALKYVFDLLGISCTGSDDKCRDPEQTQYCTGSAAKKKPGEDDFKVLDELIKNIEKDGVEPLQTACAAANYLPCPNPTTASVSGGTPDPNGFTGEPIVEDDPADDPFDDFFTDILPPSDDLTEDDIEPEQPTVVTLEKSVTGTKTILLRGNSNVSARINSVRRFSATGFSIVNIAGDQLETSSVFEPVDQTPNVQLLFTLTRDRARVSQGETITMTLTCVSGSVENNTEFPYFMFGGIRSSDFLENTTNGIMIMRNNVAVKSITISESISVSNETEVLFSIPSAGLSKTFTLVNREPASQVQQPAQPTFTPPTLGPAEVDEDGQIIDIPVIDSGDPYLFPPIINVFGEGFGAFVSPVLDDNGRLVKVKVERPGRGFVPNRKNTNCVIDGFVVIRPGVSYTEPPKIYVDGDDSIARAIINSNGNLIDVEIINKTKVFTNRPRIEIVGGNGGGAKAIPSFSCFDQESYTRYSSEVAPSGVDSVVDCP